MIKSFKSREAEQIWRGEVARRLPRNIQNVVRRKLRMLNRSLNLNDLRIPPGNRLERLSGKRRGQHSIRVNSQWRICFIWSRGEAFDVEIVDYH